ncbi:hypothetical protein [Streptomyces indicus]|uniref:Helix-turn-helix domain-containing protein n=1 Tax=Streptomyces indicus TaxID=417292 RepID=A0A1G9J8Q4_9ACTN|nr:hypothetical protein [Streptomyces indicus]SDL33930.1 hypothetical protein SAMN05421806_12853 [Streptomyces indicus]
MPKKTDRVTTLPGGLVPLLTQREIETYYGVSDWQILQWIKAGMPTEPFAGRGRRFCLEKCERWHAEQTAQTELAATA